MGELEKTYADQVAFEIISAEETAKRGDEIEAYGFTDLKHGLVIFDPSGNDQVRLPGHAFGKEEIEAGLRKVLDG